MASFESELSRMLSQFAPQGGFGIPNIGAFEDSLRRQSAIGARRATTSDLDRLRRMGLGRSVAGAFSGGARQQQFGRDLMDALAGLQARNAELSESQRQSLLGIFAPMAFQKSQQPSFLSTLLGGLGGTALNLFGPGLAMKALGNPQLDLIQKLLGGGQASPGTGFAGFNNFSLTR